MQGVRRAGAPHLHALQHAWRVAALTGSPRPQALLLTTEALLTVSYLYQIPVRLGCDFVSADVQARLELVGVHGSAAACLPAFLLYLATLFHNFHLRLHQVWPGSAMTRWPPLAPAWLRHLRSTGWPLVCSGRK